MAQRNLGALGEAKLAEWAAARGISAQKVTDDRYGWDYFLEFPPTRAHTLPPYPQDREPAAISCLVQVKSTGTGDLNRPVELARWLQLIKKPLPSFFLVLDFGEDVVPRAAYLVPIDSASIHRVLRRIRELDSQGKDIAAHRMSVICNEEHRLTAPDGESLERAIRNHIGPSFVEYIRQKFTAAEKAGYDVSQYNFTFQVSAEELQGASLLECLVDLSLGLREPLPVGRAEIRDVRFGIPARVPDQEFEAGEFKIIPKSVDVVEVTLSLGIRVVRMAMEMFLPCGLPVKEMLDTGLLKVLLKSELFHFVLCESSMKIHFCCTDRERPKKLRDFYDLARVVQLFESNAKKKDDIKITIRSNSQILRQGSLGCSNMIDPGLVGLAEIIINAWEIAKHFDVQDEVELTVDILMVQEERFKILRSVLSAEAHQMKVGWFWKRSQMSRGSTRVVVPFGMEVFLGHLRGTVVFSVWGDMRRTGRKREGMIEWEVVTSETRIEAKHTSRLGEKGTLSLSATVNAIADTYSDISGVTCMLPDYYLLPPMES